MLYDATYMRYLSVDEIIGTESTMEEGENEEYYLMGVEFQFYKIKGFVGMDGGDGGTTM